VVTSSHYNQSSGDCIYTDVELPATVQIAPGFGADFFQLECGTGQAIDNRLALSFF
jgi:hypothetical protein